MSYDGLLLVSLENVSLNENIDVYEQNMVSYVVYLVLSTFL